MEIKMTKAELKDELNKTLQDDTTSLFGAVRYSHGDVNYSKLCISIYSTDAQYNFIDFVSLICGDCEDTKIVPYGFNNDIEHVPEITYSAEEKIVTIKW